MIQIFIVDDSPIVRKFIQRDINLEDVQFNEASSGEEALAKLAQVKPALITLDIEMNDLNGYEVCKAIRQGEFPGALQHPELTEVPIIFVTTEDTLAGREKGFDAGATDFIVKPFAQEEIQKTVVEILSPEQAHKGQRVLIADDSRMTRAIIRSTLELLGVAVTEAENGVEALHQLYRDPHGYDLVLVDFDMPEMDGLTFCINTKKNKQISHIPIVFLSAVSEREYILSAFKAGASDYLLKPFVKEELIARLKLHLNSKKQNDLNQKLLHQLKRESRFKDEFLSLTAHDLRSPLHSIIGFAELIQTIPDLAPEKVQQYCQFQINSGNLLSEQISGLLELGRLASQDVDLNTRSCDILPLMETSLEMIQVTAQEKSIVCHLQLPEGPTNAIIDVSAFNRILSNLLTNAVKFTHLGGEIWLRLEYSNSEVQVIVKDSGVGLEPGMKDTLFQRNPKNIRSGTNHEPGNGLGMFIVQALTLAQGGEVEVESEPGQGCTFTVTLPRDRGSTSVQGQKPDYALPKANA